MQQQRKAVSAVVLTFAAALAAASVALIAQTSAPPAPADADRMYDVIRRGDLAALRTLVDHGADVNLVERRGGATPLLHSATVGSLDTMRYLIEKGANVNAKSYAGMTSLMGAVNDLDKVRLLVEHGADVNMTTSSGRTALHLAAMGGSSGAVVRYLLEHGADARAVDHGNVTTLMAATIGNDTDSIRQLLDAGADVNAAVTGDDVGDFQLATPLMLAAAAGNSEAVHLLLAKGANVNARSGPPNAKVKNGTIALGNFTPLLLASTYGPNALVLELVKAGANVNVQDARGMTPLMLAVTADHGDPAIASTLLAAGADVATKSLAGETAMDWALKSGRTTRYVATLEAAHAPASDVARGQPHAALLHAANPRAAAERGLTVIQSATTQFFTNGGCVSCHSQNITDMAIGEARAAHISVDEAGASARDAGTAAQFTSIATRLFERMDAPVVDIPLYTLSGFAGAGHAPDRATDALVFNIAPQQASNGAWRRSGATVARPPLSDGDTSITALGIRALATYGPPGRAAEMRQRISRSMAYLRGVTPVTAEDRAYRLLGLLWGGATRDDVAGYAREAAGKQHGDGGWSQNDTLDTDVYSTSLMIYALLQAGVPSADPAITRGVAYLLASQRENGSWYVRSRAPKFQPYFEGGFPYEHDQWISSMATGWATIALAAAQK